LVTFRSARASMVTVLLATVAAPLAGQPCAAAERRSIGLEAGAVSYEVAGGTSGLEWGVVGGLAFGFTSVRAGYHRSHLTDAAATPHAVRVVAQQRLLDVGPLSVCAGVHAAGSRFDTGEDRATVLAGGLGLAVSAPVVLGGTEVTSFLEGRGLGARSQATILGLTTEETGFSLGLEAGATAAVGRAWIRVSGALDGFAPGLGITPYPGRAMRVAVAYRF
jgi:hypothetical protein